MIMLRSIHEVVLCKEASSSQCCSECGEYGEYDECWESLSEIRSISSRFITAHSTDSHEGIVSRVSHWIFAKIPRH